MRLRACHALSFAKKSPRAVITLLLSAAASSIYEYQSRVRPRRCTQVPTSRCGHEENVVSACLALLISCIVTLSLTPRVRSWAIARGVVDEPGGRRINRRIIPRLGGIAVIVGFFVPLALLAIVKTALMRSFLNTHLAFGLVLGGLLVGVVGAIDDVRGLGPWTKLGAQLLGASIAYTFGYRIDAVNVPLLGELNMGYAGPLVTVMWFLAITNAINLIDGLDGLAGGISFFATVTNLCLALSNQSNIVVLLSSSLGGALLGFLRYNWYPASIFLGDAGSMFLGFVLAATSIAGATTKSSTAVAIFAPMIALGVPITDTLFAMVRRKMARKPIFSADRGHIHHRLLDLGLTHRDVVIVLYVTSLLLATAALGVAFGRSWHIGAALALAFAVVMGLVRAIIKSPARMELEAAHRESQAPAVSAPILPITPTLAPTSSMALAVQPAGAAAITSLARPARTHTNGTSNGSGAYKPQRPSEWPRTAKPTPSNGATTVPSTSALVESFVSSAAGNSGVHKASRLSIQCEHCPADGPCTCAEIVAPARPRELRSSR